MGTHPWSSRGPSSLGHSCRGPCQGCRLRDRCTDLGTGLWTCHIEARTNLAYSGTDRTRSCHVLNTWGQDNPLERETETRLFHSISFLFPPHLSPLSLKLTSGISPLSKTSCSSYEHALRDSISGQFLKSQINRLNFITLIKFIMLVPACFYSRHLKTEILRGRGFSELWKEFWKWDGWKSLHYLPRRTRHDNLLRRCSCPGCRSRDRHRWGRCTGPAARRTPVPSSRCSTCTHPCCTVRSHCTARDKPLQRRRNERMQEGKQMREWGKDRRRGCLRGISENQLLWEKFRYEM